MYVLGLATMTESSAVLMHNGRVVAASEEERFSRIKHDGGFPTRSIEFVLESQGITIRDLAAVAIYWDPFKLGHRAKFMLDLLVHNPRTFAEKSRRAVKVWNGDHTSGAGGGWGTIFRIRKQLVERFGSAPRQIYFFDHHRCHMASCFYASPFTESAILIMDGVGEAACTTWAVGRGTQMTVLDEHLLPHSLGHFYSSITGYLGLGMLDGEYRLMGLAPYGDPSGAAWIRRNLLRSNTRGRYMLDTGVLDYHRALRGDFAGGFSSYFGAPRLPGDDTPAGDHYRDVAASTQRAFEEVVLEMASELRRRTGLSRLTIAGGCGLNCVANGRILREGIFDEICVPPVPHDAGGALGAAMLCYSRLTGRRPEPLMHAQLGPDINPTTLERELGANGRLVSSRHSEEALCARAAEHLARGSVIGWIRGPMEYGPRALGNRSLLADPRSPHARELINAKVKKRELYRPFAPSVKAEKASEYFELEQSSPFMTIAVPVRPEARALIPAVTHVDGTARPQTVDQASNPSFWRLIDEFEKRTGVACVLNTSFNIQEPIVCTPAEALSTFGNSSIDALVIGDFWVERRTSD